jgi:hypothetical protein
VSDSVTTIVCSFVVLFLLLIFCWGLPGFNDLSLVLSTHVQLGIALIISGSPASNFLLLHFLHLFIICFINTLIISFFWKIKNLLLIIKFKYT